MEWGKGVPGRSPGWARLRCGPEELAPRATPELGLAPWQEMMQGPWPLSPPPGTWPPGTNRRPWHGCVQRLHTAPWMGLGSSLLMDTPCLLSAQRPASRGPVLFPVCPSPWRPPPAQDT